MDFERLYEMLPGVGWLSEGEAKLLWNFAGEFSGDVLEVGSYEGRSSVLLASLGRRLYCVDPFDGFAEGRTGEEIHRKLVDNLQSRDLANVVVYWGKVETWPRKSVGFAYLDGDHTADGTKRQIDVALACGAKGIAIHDVNDSGGGLPIKLVALEMLGLWESRVERLATWRIL